VGKYGILKKKSTIEKGLRNRKRGQKSKKGSEIEKRGRKLEKG